MIKIWCRQVPIFGSFLLASTLANSGTAMAAGTPGAQPTPTTTPGIATPDEAVRRMALGAINDSQKIAAKQVISSSNTNNFSPKTTVTNGSKSAMLNPSKVLNNCRGGSCEFNSAQPPVTLGTAAPMGINSTINPRNVPASVAAMPASPTENSESAALKSFDKQNKTAELSSYNPAEVLVSQPQTTDQANKKSSLLGGVNQQLAYLKEMAISSSKQFFTALPQIDTSLFAIGNSFASAKAVSFNPRLTLGNLDTTTKPTAYFHSRQHQSFSSEPIVLKQPTQDKMLLLSKNLPSSNTPKLLLLSSKI